jgi:DNA polymerase-1
VEAMNRLAALVDGSGFMYRAYYGLPPLTNSCGQPVGAVYGFCSMLISLLERHKSDLFCVALDSGRRTFRSEIYAEYKANRDETPPDLKLQFPLMKEACAAFGIPIVAMVGFEADDLIATYARKLSAQEYEVRIISCDKDLMQLVDDRVHIFDPLKFKIVRSEDVMAKYGVFPSQMAAFQALMGDPSDNIPGVQGIGPKTASKLLNEFQTLEGIYRNIDQIKRQKIRENLINQKEALYMSLKLVTLANDIAVDEDLHSLTVGNNYDRGIDFLNSHNFDSLVDRWAKFLGKA